jgi:hypothetical protein
MPRSDLVRIILVLDSSIKRFTDVRRRARRPQVPRLFVVEVHRAVQVCLRPDPTDRCGAVAFNGVVGAARMCQAGFRVRSALGGVPDSVAESVRRVLRKWWLARAGRRSRSLSKSAHGGQAAAESGRMRLGAPVSAAVPGPAGGGATFSRAWPVSRPGI